MPMPSLDLVTPVLMVWRQPIVPELEATLAAAWPSRLVLQGWTLRLREASDWPRSTRSAKRGGSGTVLFRLPLPLQEANNSTDVVTFCVCLC